MSPIRRRARVFALLALLLIGAGGATSFLLANCGPFTDVGSLICPFVLELYYTGITAGTSATTYSPGDPVTRGQMAVFIAASLDQSLRRANRRAPLAEWWTPTPHFDQGLGFTPLPTPQPGMPASDGTDVWVPDMGGNVYRVHASDGKLLDTWTGATSGVAAICAMGRVFIIGAISPNGSLYMIDPSQPSGMVTTVTTALGGAPNSLVFDGASIWTANSGVAGGSVSRVTPSSTSPWPVQTASAGFSSPLGIVFDGSNVWVTDNASNSLFQLDSSGNILLTVAVPSPTFPTFDGRNIWVPENLNAAAGAVAVVRPTDGTILSTLTDSHLAATAFSAFDGERIIVAPYSGGFGNYLVVWKATDLSLLGTPIFQGGDGFTGLTCDGTHFWASLKLTGGQGCGRI